VRGRKDETGKLKGEEKERKSGKRKRDG